MFLRFIKDYLQRAREEASQAYAIGPAFGAGEPGAQDGGNTPWIGIDLDGTLAFQDSQMSLSRVGEPVPAMMDLVKEMISNGVRVKIFTARASDPDQVPIIREWLVAHQLPELEITNVKDYQMIRLYDDRSIQVEKNTGRLVVEK